MELFVVTCDGYYEGYGSEIYLVGVFESAEEAETAKSNPNLHYNITKVPLGKAFPMRKNKGYDSYYNKNYIGGYTE